MNGNCYYSEGVNPTITTNKSEGNKIAIRVLTPERAEKRQNGRRFKEDGEEAFTLTSQDRHGVAIGIDDLYANRGPRFYDEESPTLRSDRHGLKAAVNVGPVEMSGNKLSESDDVAHALNANDQRKVLSEHQTKTMIGYNATLNKGGHDSDSTYVKCERLQRPSRPTDDDNSGDVFAIDKGYRAKEREVVNCLTAKEDRGLSRHVQEGTLICMKV